MKTALGTKKNIKELVDQIDWGFGDANTKELTHEIHRYSGKYIPQIARTAIELISSPGEKVLDPYVGSGTTLLEANMSSRHSIGIDLNPLAVLISKVKITPVPERDLHELKNYFEDLVNKIYLYKSKQSSFLEKLDSVAFNIANDSRLNDDWYKKWFSSETLEELLILDAHIKKYPKKDGSDIAMVSFSNILRKCSNAHSGYPNVMLDRNKNNKISPLPHFLKSLKETTGKIEKLNNIFKKEVEIEVVHGDARQLEIEDDSIDAVVTHPPYIGSIPYAEYGTLSLKWLGFEPKEIDQKLTGGKRQSKDVVERFVAGYKEMLSESYRVLKPKRHMFILIGDPTIKGQFIDLARITKELSQDVGFNLITEKKREGINRRANKMGPETLFFFQKV